MQTQTTQLKWTCKREKANGNANAFAFPFAFRVRLAYRSALSGGLWPGVGCPSGFGYKRV